MPGGMTVNNLARLFEEELHIKPKIKGVQWSNGKNIGRLKPTRIRMFTVRRPMRHKQSARARTRRHRPNIKAYRTVRKNPRKPEKRRPVEEPEENENANEGPEPVVEHENSGNEGDNEENNN
jgi:hypothetical protein